MAFVMENILRFWPSNVPMISDLNIAFLLISSKTKAVGFRQTLELLPRAIHSYPAEWLRNQGVSNTYGIIHGMPQ